MATCGVGWVGERRPGCLPVAGGLGPPCQAALAGLLVRQEEVGYTAWLLGVAHLLTSMRWAELCALGLGELLIPQLSLAGTAVCWDKRG